MPKLTNITDAAPHPHLMSDKPLSVGSKTVIAPGKSVTVSEDEADRLLSHFGHHLVRELPDWYVAWKEAQPKPVKKAARKKAAPKKAKK